MEEECGCIDALGDHHSPSCGPERRTQNKRINLMHLSQAGHEANHDTGGM